MTSLLFADPSGLRAIAHRIASHADRVRAQAAALAGATAQARWHSPAATAFRHRAAGISRDLRRAAAELDDAAAAMRRHAANVSSLAATLRAELDSAAHDVQAAGKAALDGVGGAAEAVLHVAGL